MDSNHYQSYIQNVFVISFFLNKNYSSECIFVVVRKIMFVNLNYKACPVRFFHTYDTVQ